METIFNAWQYSWKVHPQKDTYLILFGNREEGWQCSHEELKTYWRMAVKNSKYRHYGDVTLLYKGQIIRSVHNFQRKILDKSTPYYCHYTKNAYKEPDGKSSN